MFIFKNKWVKIFLAIALIVIFVYGILYMVFKNVNKNKKTLEMQLNILNKEITYLEADNQKLKQGIFDSSKEEELEKEVRMNYGYKKEGETAVILSATTTKPNDDQNAVKSNV